MECGLSLLLSAADQSLKGDEVSKWSYIDIQIKDKNNHMRASGSIESRKDLPVSGGEKYSREYCYLLLFVLNMWIRRIPLWV